MRQFDEPVVHAEEATLRAMTLSDLAHRGTHLAKATRRQPARSIKLSYSRMTGK